MKPFAIDYVYAGISLRYKRLEASGCFELQVDKYDDKSDYRLRVMQGADGLPNTMVDTATSAVQSSTACSEKFYIHLDKE